MEIKSAYEEIVTGILEESLVLRRWLAEARARASGSASSSPLPPQQLSMKVVVKTAKEPLGFSTVVEMM